MLRDPVFWSFLFVLALIFIGWAAIKQLKALYDKLEARSLNLETSLAQVECLVNTLPAFTIGTLDVSIHTRAELFRLRESVLELARDVEGLAVLEQIALRASQELGRQLPKVTDQAFRSTRPPPPEAKHLTNQVFARHLPLPLELPVDTSAEYPPWVCPICKVAHAHSWTWWCPNCRCRTLHPGVVQESFAPQNWQAACSPAPTTERNPRDPEPHA